ncbi:MAG: alpha/beta hydrolase [Anaerolineales bacterium]|nr:alpha/beta hydrolase [Anaerolineales bacterium]
MKTLSRILSILSAFFGILTLIPSPKGRRGGYIWLPKLWAGAWSPFLAIAGALGALLGLGRKDRAAILFGMFGAFAGARHTQRVTKKHGAFDLAFGQDWEQRIPPEQWTRLSRPYQLIQPAKPLGLYQKDVNLGTRAAPLLADIWLPPRGVKPSRLGVIYLHGSWWQAVDKDFLTRPLFARLVNQGHVVMDVAYSLAPAANMKQMIDEVKRAIVWMKTHADELDIDPNRIVLMGGSVGGGQLALLAAYTPNTLQSKRVKTDTSVRGVISMYGVTDMTAYFHEYGAINPQPEYSSQMTEDMRPRVHDKTWLDKFMTRARVFPAYRYGNMPGGAALMIDIFGGTLNEIPETYKRYSPLTHVGAHCPPTLQIFGDEDFAIDVSHGRRLHAALQNADVPSAYVELPETVHAFDQYFGVSRRVAPAAQIAANDIEQFLALMA